MTADATTSHDDVVDELEEELDWLERPRGHACPHCAAHILFSAHLDRDKAVHTEWHRRQEHAADLTVDAFEAVYDELAARPPLRTIPVDPTEPKGQTMHPDLAHTDNGGGTEIH